MAILVGVGGIIALLLTLPKLAVAQHLASVAEITATSDGNEKAVAIINSHIGQRAVARSDLSPNGFIRLNEQEMGAVAQHGEFIKAGTTVMIVDMQFGEAVVRTDSTITPESAKAQVPT
jgi:membrane-bound ClpP family serine protease